MVSTECKLVRQLLVGHGFHEVHYNSNNFSLLWMGIHIKPYMLRSFREHQKVNHFPRSYELTRKDRFCKNIQRMQHTKGKKHFDFIPDSYVLPAEYQDFCATFTRDKGPWIVKPVASSRGRGIFLVTGPDQIPLDDTLVVSRYISNPLLINGFKFDVRLYVAVTSYDPLVVYLYEEGLARFATIRYEKGARHYRNQCMHLTNYSVNKRSDNYVRCENPNVEDFGNKWSMSAMLRYLKGEGYNTQQLMTKIEDVIIKSLISAEMTIATACKMFVPYRNNCFELYGFDILIDDKLKPWVLEINLSPSLYCDSPLDRKVKSGMITDVFNLAGFLLYEPLQLPRATSGQKASNLLQKGRSRNSCAKKVCSQVDINQELSSTDRRVLRTTQEEYKRRGGFVRIFPTAATWETFSHFLEFRSNLNEMLHENLFLNRRETAQMKNRLALVRVQQYEKQKADIIGLDRDEEDEILPEQENLQGLPVCIYEGKASSSSSTESMESFDKSHCNAASIIGRAAHLSQTQVRNAFAVYLLHVRNRLMDESNVIAECQIELVLVFLRRAASNLPHPVVITAPSSSLSLTDRRLSLANQLWEFIRVYEKETRRQERISLASISQKGTGDFQESIDDRSFNVFLKKASEKEVEEVLSAFFTASNKSASIFIGKPSAENASIDKHIHFPYVTRVNSGSRKEATFFGNSKDAANMSSMAMLHKMSDSAPAVVKLPRESTFQKAASARPHSVAFLTSRPTSQGSRINRSHSSATTHALGDDPLSDALKRLVLRQQARQYSTSNLSSFSPDPQRNSNLSTSPCNMNENISLNMETMDNRERTYDAHPVLDQYDRIPSGEKFAERFVSDNNLDNRDCSFGNNSNAKDRAEKTSVAGKDMRNAESPVWIPQMADNNNSSDGTRHEELVEKLLSPLPSIENSTPQPPPSTSVLDNQFISSYRRSRTVTPT